MAHVQGRQIPLAPAPGAVVLQADPLDDADVCAGDLNLVGGALPERMTGRPELGPAGGALRADELDGHARVRPRVREVGGSNRHGVVRHLHLRALREDAVRGRQLELGGERRFGSVQPRVGAEGARPMPLRRL